MTTNHPETVKAKLFELLDKYQSLHIDASNTDSISTYGFSSNGRIHQIDNIMGDSYREQCEFTRMIFNVFSTIAGEAFKPLYRQHCDMSFNWSRWGVTYIPLNDGFVLKIEGEPEYTLAEFIEIETNRINAFASRVSLTGSDDVMKPLNGKNGWNETLIAFACNQSKSQQNKMQ